MVIPITTPRETLTCNVTNISSSTHPTIIHWKNVDKNVSNGIRNLPCGCKWQLIFFWMNVSDLGYNAASEKFPRFHWASPILAPQVQKTLKNHTPLSRWKKFPQLDKLNEVCNTMYWPYKDQKASNCICWYIKLSFLT